MTIEAIIISILTGLGGGIGSYLKIRGERKKTSEERTKQINEIDMRNHDEMLELKFEVNKLKEDVTLHNNVLSNIQSTLQTMNNNIVELKTIIKYVSNSEGK